MVTPGRFDPQCPRSIIRGPVADFAVAGPVIRQGFPSDYAELSESCQPGLHGIGQSVRNESPEPLSAPMLHRPARLIEYDFKFAVARPRCGTLIVLLSKSDG
jgi:hypothetical protein